jgi:hypothetical protein
MYNQGIDGVHGMIESITVIVVSVFPLDKSLFFVVAYLGLYNTYTILRTCGGPKKFIKVRARRKRSSSTQKVLHKLGTVPMTMAPLSVVLHLDWVMSSFYPK